jgi:hypothetical protein
LNNLGNLRGHEEWVEFPFLQKFNLEKVSFENQENVALSPDAFPLLNELDLLASEPFYAKILESCQRESSRPIKRVSLYNHLVKECFEALLMVPVEELNLYFTQSAKKFSSDIPWSEEKIITKTLKKFKCVDFDAVSSTAFLINCKQLESLDLHRISTDIDLSLLSNLPLLKELAFRPPSEKMLFLIKDAFRSAVVLASLQKLELIREMVLSRFEGLENVLPNLRIIESSARVDERQKEENLLNSFLYVVRNFPKVEEICFNGEGANKSFKEFKPMQTRIPRLLKKEKPSLIIYYPISCQYEPEPEKEGTRRDREDSDEEEEEEEEEEGEEEERSESSPQQKQRPTKAKKPRAKKASPKKSTATKKKQKAKVETKKKPAGKKTTATSKKKKIAPTKKAAKKK